MLYLVDYEYDCLFVDRLVIYIGDIVVYLDVFEKFIK